MLRLLGRPGSPNVLRRLMAFVLGVVLLAGCVEPLLADACDGDAPRTAATAILPHVDGGTLVRAADLGALGAGVEVAATAVTLRGSEVLAASATASVDAPDGPAQRDRAPGHAVHVCHCTHAHGGALSDGYAFTTRTTRPVPRAVDARSDRLPPSPALEPQLRPPAARHAA